MRYRKTRIVLRIASGALAILAVVGVRMSFTTHARSDAEMDFFRATGMMPAETGDLGEPPDDRQTGKLGHDVQALTASIHYHATATAGRLYADAQAAHVRTWRIRAAIAGGLAVLLFVFTLTYRRRRPA